MRDFESRLSSILYMKYVTPMLLEDTRKIRVCEVEKHSLALMFNLRDHEKIENGEL